MAKINGLVVASRIVPTDDLDSYPTHDADYGRGGQRSVATLLDRDAVSADRRKEGMLVWVAETGIEYRLVGGTENSNWVESADVSTEDLSDISTALAGKVDNDRVLTDVPVDAVFTDTTYDVATQTEDGLMSSEDKVKVDTIVFTDDVLILPSELEVLVADKGIIMKSASGIRYRLTIADDGNLETELVV
jgi:hypothetical protein